jgi:predicted amidohydrolase YtcJ
MNLTWFPMKALTSLAIASAAISATDQSAAASFNPDLLIVNASIHTMDTVRPTAEAIVIHGQRILALGTTSELRGLAGPRTRVVDAHRNTVLPGFNDAHTHFLTGGFSLADVDLRAAQSPEEMARLLGDYTRKLPKGRWVLGGNWDHERWPGAPLPTKEMIDAATPDHPVFVNRLDGHMALANSLALKLAAITKNTPDPAGGVIVRNPATGEPTGVLKDAAEALIERVVPAKSLGEKYSAALAATAHAAELGVTSLADMSADEDVGLYQLMLERGELKTRIYAIRSIVSWEVLAKSGVRAAFGSDMLRIGGLKGFADGSLGSSTALFFEPYSDTPNTRGLLFDQMLPEGAMRQRVQAADQHGLQVMIHAIGDEANLRILDLYREVAERNDARDRRFRIEHAQHLRASEIPRFGGQKVIASMQPYHAADDGRWCEKRLGPDRSKGSYVFRSLLDAGAVLAFGSDWPVAPLNPLLGIKAAVTRQKLDGKRPNGWLPMQKIALDEALRAFTFGSAYAEFSEPVKGTLTPGKLADLVVLDRDLYKTDPTTIDQARVVLTIMDGKVVYDATTK